MAAPDALRVGICAPYDLARDGGVNSHIRSQAAALRNLGHLVTVFGASSRPDPDDAVAVSGCVSLVIGNTDTPIGFDPRAWYRVGQLFARERFDVVHVHEPLMPLVPWIAVLRSRAPVVATFHTHREQGHRFYPRFRPVLAPIAARLDLRLAVSAAAMQTVAATFPGRYEIVPNGIDAERFAAPAVRPQEMPADRLHVLYVGRLEPRKGVDRLIRAMADVQRLHPSARLVIVGEGPDRASLQTLAATLRVEACFTGRVADAQLPSFLQAADVVCSPALGDESFGIVLLEALAAGRAVVATRIAGYEELAREARPISLVPPDDVAALAAELAGLLEAPERRSALGAQGPAAARPFSWSSVAGRLERFYRTLLSRGARGMVTSGQNEYGSSGLNASEASDRLERPFTR